MRVILLFLNLLLVYSFRNILLSTTSIRSFICLKDSSRSDGENVCFTYDIDPTSSNNLHVNSGSYVNKSEESLAVILSRKLNKTRRENDGGFDQRDVGETCLEKIYNQIQEKQTLEKLRKYVYQMNLLKKLENGGVSDFEKLRAIYEYNYYMESSKYVSNIQSGGLYKNWTNNDL